MANWKYKVVKKRINDVSETALDNLGSNGWELVFMSQLWNGKIIGVFKKEK